MKRKILNIFISLGFTVTALSAGYVLLVPDHIKEMLPQLNWLVALVTGGSAGAFSSIGLYFRTTMDTQNIVVEEKIEKSLNAVTDMAKLVIDLKNQYSELKEVLNNLLTENNRENVTNQTFLIELQRLKELLTVDLESKLTNPLIDKDAEVKIRSVLNGKPNDKA